MQVSKKRSFLKSINPVIFGDETILEIVTTDTHKKIMFAGFQFKSGTSAGTIDWGDGTKTNITSTQGIEHDYLTVGTFYIKISNDFSYIDLQMWNSYGNNIYIIKQLLKLGSAITSFLQNFLRSNYEVPNVFQYCDMSNCNARTLGHACCYQQQALKTIILPSTLTLIDSYAFEFTPNVETIISYANPAPTASYSNIFGNGAGGNHDTGCYFKSAGTNTLYIPRAADSSYRAGRWQSMLLNSSICGFHIEYIEDNLDKISQIKIL